MLYREFGNTGVKISSLGFGAMRLPTYEKDGKHPIDMDKAVETMRLAYELGVNYYDTAYFYHDGESKIAVGKAVKPFRDKVYISTKYPVEEKSSRDHYRENLEGQLRDLDTDYCDFFHFHGINLGTMTDKILKSGLLEEAIKLKQEGLIRHISFSFHDKPENMAKIIDLSQGLFESVLCQYNLLDTSNQEGIKYARSKGLGVVVMGPVGGGRLVEPSEVLNNMTGSQIKSTPELALRFVLSNPDVSCALSGMGSVQMVRENVATACIPEPFSYEENENVKKALEKVKRLADLYCTGCNYCIPCPKNIDIPSVFSMMNAHNVFKLTKTAKERFSGLGKSQWAGAHPDDCVECGQCEAKCPQKIKIIEQLKETTRELG